MKKHLVCLATVMTLIMIFTQMVCAVSPLVSTKGKAVKSYGVVLPIAPELDNKELAEVEGEGFLAGVLGAVAGAITGAISYTTGYLWDTYVDDALEAYFGETSTVDEDPEWQWSSFYDSAGKAAVTGFLGGLIMP